MESTTDQTKAAKKALVAAGYKGCSVTHGRGTAYCWIYVGIRDRKETREEDATVEAIVAKAAGRDTWKNKDILVSFSYYPPVAAVCPACGATGSDINRYFGADDLERDHCRKCGKVFPVA